MLKVGLTGGIASGKSVIGEMFAALGVHLIQADAISHQLIEPGNPVYDQVVQHFGQEILEADGRINRRKLAAIAFGEPPRIEELNRIVHPAVLEKQKQWMNETGRKDPTSIVMVEAALILEAGARKQFDRLIVVTCRPEQRIQRVAERLHLDFDSAKKEVERRMASQLSDEEKVKAADYVIDNSGSLEEGRKRVQEIFGELKQQAISFAGRTSQAAN